MFVLLTVCSVFFVGGLCVRHKHEEVCYGRSFKFPVRYTPPLYTGPLFFTPREGGPMKLLMNNGKSQYPPLDVTFYDVSLRDVREDDSGYFSISSEGSIVKFMTLKVLDCAEEITKQYLDSLEHAVQDNVDLVEFTPLHSPKQRHVLWNRSDPTVSAGGRGSLKNNEWRLAHLTQKDNGFYNFRDENGRLVSRMHLVVKEHTRSVTVYDYDRLEIAHPWLARTKTMTFTPEHGDEPASTMRDGVLVHDYWFNSRIRAVANGIEVLHVESQDTGTFRFKDSEDNLIMTVHLEVNDGHIITTISYISFGLLIPATIMVYCCSYFMKSHYKKYHSAPETHETPDNPRPPVLYYPGITKAAGSSAPPSYTLSYRPLGVPKAPAVTSDLPVYKPVNVHMAPTQPQVREPVTVPTPPQAQQPVDINVTPTQPEVAPSGGRPSILVAPVSSDVLSSGGEPTFKLKGVTFPSAPPLGPSDKFNFL